MIVRLFPIALFLLPLDIQAITWNFDTEDDAQGWTAREDNASRAASSVSPLLRSAVADGIWRIYPHPFEPGRNPAVELISPLLRRDSALFDRLRMRCRLVHLRPVQGALTVHWTNPANRDRAESLSYPNPDSAASSIDYLDFYQHQNLTYTTEWQEVVIGGLQPEVYEVSGHKHKQMWEGELLDIRLKLRPYMVTAEAPTIAGPGEVPEAIEVDWIQLTGVEEQLQGELPPPASPVAIPPGEYFALPAFYPVDQVGLGSRPLTRNAARLGDVDGDGDLDLVSLWSIPDQGDGWTVLLNDGSGGFTETAWVERFPGSGPFFPIPQLDAADLDGDGRLDLMMGYGLTVKVMENRGEEGWAVTLDQEQVLPMGLGDADGDGHEDLWVLTLDADRQLRVYLNDGQGGFPQQIDMTPELFEEGMTPQQLVEHVPGERVAGMLWTHFSSDPVQGYEVTYLDRSGEVIQAPLIVDVTGDRLRYVGDFDQDGDVDAVATRGSGPLLSVDRGAGGLDLLVNPGDARLQSVPWYDEVVVGSDVEFLDLDGDGRLDPVFVDSNYRGPAVVVGVGQKDGLPIQEGRYPLEGRGGVVLGGDVDGDGDVDLVVLEMRRVGGGSGVHVLLNRFSEQRTAVVETGEELPTGFRLQANFPNPFNPQTWIPFEIPEGGGPVELWIYNLLGQPVRRLVSGRLMPGHHVAPWDGRDERGQGVSSGVYLYRLEAGAWRATGKMLKAE